MKSEICSILSSLSPLPHLSLSLSLRANRAPSPCLGKKRKTSKPKIMNTLYLLRALPVFDLHWIRKIIATAMIWCVFFCSLYHGRVFIICWGPKEIAINTQSPVAIHSMFIIRVPKRKSDYGKMDAPACVFCFIRASEEKRVPTEFSNRTHRNSSDLNEMLLSWLRTLLNHAVNFQHWKRATTILAQETCVHRLNWVIVIYTRLLSLATEIQIVCCSLWWAGGSERKMRGAK